MASNNLIFIAGEFILPEHLTFYDLMKFRYTNGTPIFPFVMNQKNINNDSSASQLNTDLKIYERTWYEKNRHIFPQSRWEVFDDMKPYVDPRFTPRDKTTGSEEMTTAFYKKKKVQNFVPVLPFDY